MGPKGVFQIWENMRTVRSNFFELTQFAYLHTFPNAYCLSGQRAWNQKLSNCMYIRPVFKSTVPNGPPFVPTIEENKTNGSEASSNFGLYPVMECMNRFKGVRGLRIIRPRNSGGNTIAHKVVSITVILCSRNRRFVVNVLALWFRGRWKIAKKIEKNCYAVSPIKYIF